MHHGGIIQHHGILHVPVRELIREFFSEISAHFAQTNLAVTEGKALEQLKERVVGLFGIREISVEESRWERRGPDIKVTFRSSERISPLVERLIHLNIERVNRRFGTRIRWSPTWRMDEHGDSTRNEDGNLNEKEDLL